MDVAARARIQGLLSWQAIADETQPVRNSNEAFRDIGEFFRQETRNFLTGSLARDLLSEQPHHVEIVAEKLTVRSILAKVANDHTMPMTISRGMCSLPAKRKVYERYVRQQEREVDSVMRERSRPGRRHHRGGPPGIIRTGLRSRQRRSFQGRADNRPGQGLKLAPSMEAKTSSPTYFNLCGTLRRIAGTNELEAMEPADLAEELTRAIEQVIDIDLFNQEVAAEQAEAAHLIAIREQCAAFFKSLKLER